MRLHIQIVEYYLLPKCKCIFQIVKNYCIGHSCLGTSGQVDMEIPNLFILQYILYIVGA